MRMMGKEVMRRRGRGTKEGGKLYDVTGFTFGVDVGRVGNVY